MTIRLLQGDCRELLPTLPVNSVHCVVTSPPYFGLRDYGTAQWEGGDADCSHLVGPLCSSVSTLNNGKGVGEHEKLRVAGMPYRSTCGKCGARRIDAQLGLEASPEEYIATMVQVFREVRRVLRDDGTCWVNMGDSYAGNRPYQAIDNKHRDVGNNGASRVPDGLKPKDLLMMPARLAIALQADGWWLRSDIIWHKPNPMPESVTDRPTSAHEHVFLLSKSPRYFYDAEAVAEPAEASSIARLAQNIDAQLGSWRANGGAKTNGPMHAVGGATRSCRNVWTLATHPYSEAHFATFPPALAERCIKAGTSERGCCAQCGAPWVREQRPSFGLGAYNDHTQDAVAGMSAPSPRKLCGRELAALRATQLEASAIWSPSCKCGTQETKPATVLDCFAGAGTTLLVADRLQRDAIGIELNASYAAMARNRITDDAGMFAEVAD